MGRSVTPIARPKPHPLNTILDTRGISLIEDKGISRLGYECLLLILRSYHFRSLGIFVLLVLALFNASVAAETALPLLCND